MKIGITGTTGRLGRALADVAHAAGHEVVELSRLVLDLERVDEIEGVLEGLGLEVLVNPAAVTSVDACEGEGAERARLVNVEAVERMACWAAAAAVRFVQVSTDYVFSGAREGWCLAGDEPAPVQNYGEMKARAERLCLGANGQNLVVRVSWVFGPQKDCFLESALQRAVTSEEAGAVADKWSMPLYTKDGAGVLLDWALDGGMRGIVQLCNGGEPCSWWDWAQQGLDVLAQHGVELRTRTLVQQSLAEADFFVARRPVHTAMRCSLEDADAGEGLRDWREAVREYVLEYVLERFGKG